MESIVERQAIRAALALAAASAQGQSPDAIADMRDEAAHLIGMCIKDHESAEVLRCWCDDATELMHRLVEHGTLSESAALGVAAAVLRFRLVVAQQMPPVIPAPKEIGLHGAKKARALSKAGVSESQKIVREFISQHSDIRTKDLIDALSNTLSTRTIKRCLKELSDTHILRRTAHADGGVSYNVDTEG